jgi:hypothetical protein
MTTWVKPFPNSDQWRIDQAETVRLTEDGRVRITEDGGHYRIIERFSTHWVNDTTPANPWH